MRYTAPKFVFVPFKAQPAAGDLPEVFPTPFAPGPPHPLAQRAAQETQAFLATHAWVKPEMFQGGVGGKMLGVLVVHEQDGRVGYLRGFAGKLSGRWSVEGFVPPAFDLPAFERIWTKGAAEISALDDEIETLRSARPEERGASLDDALLAQKELSRSLYAELHETYQIVNARGGHTELRTLFEPRLPPGGSGDCAAPKLMARAYRLNLRPVALAEFWWGAPPPAGGRQSGVFYPACRGRCAKLLPFMLEGIECEAPPDFGIKLVADDAPVVIYEDEALLVVDKPAGLLSVRGRGPNRQDCVEKRLQERLGLDDPTWPRLVHRLDLATSGLLVAAKNKEMYVALQRQFSERLVKKRYVALVRGEVLGGTGTIDFPLGRDLDDRPRQIYDPLGGKPSITDWEVLERDAQTTRLALYPKTGRTHQLRVHLAHQRGLAAPIVGDWLYGFGGERLMLHAESITFEHPQSGDTLSFTLPGPF